MKNFGSRDTRTDRYRLPRSNEGDRVQIEQGLARELYRTWMHTKQKVLTVERMAWIEKMHGMGAVKRIRDYMDQMKNGTLL
jgi:hypothetical protein